MTDFGFTEEQIRSRFGDYVERFGHPGYIAKSITHVRSFGQVSSLGFCLDPDPILGPIASLKAVSLQFPNGFTLQDFQFCADVMDKGHVDPKVLISTVAPLETLPSVFDRCRRAA